MLTRKYRSRVASAIAVLITPLLVGVAMAGGPIVSFYPPDPVLGGSFGMAVIGRGEWVIVGAPLRDVGLGHEDAGRVYVYQEADAQHLHTIENPNPEAYSKFGFALAPYNLYGSSSFIVGVPYDQSEEFNAGIVYVYSASSGQRIFTIPNPDPDRNDLFGHSVAYVNPGKILVGAPGENSHCGVAYLFSAVTGALLQTLDNPDPDAFDWFGKVVTTAYDRAVVAAPEDDQGGPDAGTVYVFDPSNGDLLLTLSNPEPGGGSGGNDAFGASLAPHVNAQLEVNILVGAPGEDADCTDVGAAYLFDSVTGDLVRTFNNPDPDDDDIFGNAVAAGFPRYVAIAARLDDTSASNAGAVYLFNAENGSQLRTFNSPDPAIGDELGNALGVGTEGFLVGAWRDDTVDVNAGAVYLFETEFRYRLFLPIIFVVPWPVLAE